MKTTRLFQRLALLPALLLLCACGDPQTPTPVALIATATGAPATPAGQATTSPTGAPATPAGQATTSPTGGPPASPTVPASPAGSATPGASSTPSPAVTPRPALTVTATGTIPAGPSATASPPISPAAALTSSLMSALALVPSALGNVAFTDWALIKQYRGVPDLNSASPIEERMEFMFSLARDQAAASGFAIGKFRLHAETWGWDSTDLAWEANVEARGGPPVWVLRLRPDFDLAPVVARFEERGFTREEYAGAAIYSHDIDISTDWLQVTEFAILNTAVLPGEKTLVLSSSPDNVRAVLDARRRAAAGGTLAADEGMRAVANRLEPVAAAYLLPGTAGCIVSGLDQAAIDAMASGEPGEQVRAIYESMLQTRARLRQYDGMGIGYRYEQGEPLGLLALHYADAADAQADLEPRRSLANEGLSLLTKQPYRTSVFTLAGASVMGDDLVLRMRPANDMPSRFFRMVFARDVVFAGCPE